jgi:hypothetical protein
LFSFPFTFFLLIFPFLYFFFPIHYLHRNLIQPYLHRGRPPSPHRHRTYPHRRPPRCSTGHRTQLRAALQLRAGIHLPHSTLHQLFLRCDPSSRGAPPPAMEAVRAELPGGHVRGPCAAHRLAMEAAHAELALHRPSPRRLFRSHPCYQAGGLLCAQAGDLLRAHACAVLTRRGLSAPPATSSRAGHRGDVYAAACWGVRWQFSCN